MQAKNRDPRVEMGDLVILIVLKTMLILALVLLIVPVAQRGGERSATQVLHHDHVSRGAGSGQPSPSPRSPEASSARAPDPRADPNGRGR